MNGIIEILIWNIFILGLLLSYPIIFFEIYRTIKKIKALQQND